MHRHTRLARGLAALGLLAGGLATAAPAQAAVTASPCRLIASAHSDTIRLWYCDGTGGTARGYHAQAFMYYRGTVTLRTSSGAIMRSRTADINDVLAHWYNTSTYGYYSGELYKACTGVCTASGR